MAVPSVGCDVRGGECTLCVLQLPTPDTLPGTWQALRNYLLREWMKEGWRNPETQRGQTTPVCLSFTAPTCYLYTSSQDKEGVREAREVSQTSLV